MIAYLAISSAEEVTEFCEDKCADVCHICLVPQPCTEEETDCGMGEPDPAFGGICPPHPICVQKEFNCPCRDEEGNAYPLTTKVECDEDEILCTGPSPGNDCPGQDTCVPKGVDKNGDLCDGFCPITCDENTLHCSEPIDPETGCAQAPSCIDKAVDIYGEFCPTQQCPIVCLEIEFYCESPIILLGCKEEDICVTRGRDIDGELCPGTCPTECDPETEIKCNSQTESNGCTTQETCHAKARDINGEFCADNSDSHGCPIICPENEILCPAKMNILGCKDQATCYPIEKDENGNDCPASSICPTICQPNEVSCPGGIDENGCKKPDVCVKQERDFDGDLCPAHCPGICDESQILCEGHTDDRGCMTPDTCAPKGTKTKGNDVGDLCPGHCPVNCKHGEILCSSQEDCNGCMTGEMCRPKATDNNGMFCADDSASHDCPIECDEDIGEVLCPTYESVLGCKPRAMCQSRPKDSEGEFCPAHSVCEKECQSDEMLCSDGIDSRGCKNADLCIPRGRDHDGNLCPELCPPKCAEGEYFCAGLYESNGCKGSSLCIERKLDANGLTCPEACPVSCSETELKVHGETDARGCLVEDSCQANECYAFNTDFMGNDLNNCDVKTDTSQECQELCAETEGCVQFTWLGYAVGDNEDSKHKCCLKNAYYDDRQSHGGLVSGPKVCGPYCVKIQTGSRSDDRYNDGYVQITVNGNIEVPQKYFEYDQVVIDTCFETLDSISVQNENTNAWVGTISVTHNGEDENMSCDHCSGSSFERKVVADGDDNSSDMAPTQCMNGDLCTFTALHDHA